MLKRRGNRPQTTLKFLRVPVGGNIFDDRKNEAQCPTARFAILVSDFGRLNFVVNVASSYRCKGGFKAIKLLHTPFSVSPRSFQLDCHTPLRSNGSSMSTLLIIILLV